MAENQEPNQSQINIPKRNGGPIAIIILAVLILIGAGIWWKSQNKTLSTSYTENTNTSTDTYKEESTTTSDQTNTSTQDSMMAATSSNPSMSTSTKSSASSTPPTTQTQVKTFTITAQNFSFNPKEIRVKKGDTVKIILKNSGGFHDWVIDAFNARTTQIQGGQTAEVTFVADKAGTFEYYCSVDEHKQMGMRGNLIVE